MKGFGFVHKTKTYINKLKNVLPSEGQFKSWTKQKVWPYHNEREFFLSDYLPARTWVLFFTFRLELYGKADYAASLPTAALCTCDFLELFEAILVWSTYLCIHLSTYPIASTSLNNPNIHAVRCLGQATQLSVHI